MYPDIPLYPLARFAFVIASPGVVFGLIVLAAASPRWHWFWRGALLLAVTALCIPLGSREIVFACLASGGIVFLTTGVLRVGWAAYRRQTHAPSHETSSGALNFGIREMLLATALLAAAAAIFSWIVRDAIDAPLWLGWPALGYAGMLLFARLVISNEKLRSWKTAAHLLAFLVVVGATSTIATMRLDVVESLLWIVSERSAPYLIVTIQVVQAFALLVLAYFFAGAADASPWWRLIRRVMSYSLLLPVVCATGWLYWYLVRPYPPPPPKPFPGSDLVAELSVKLGEAANAPVPDVIEVSGEELSTYVNEQTKFLEDVSLSLQQPCCRQPDYEPIQIEKFLDTDQLDYIGAARQVARMYLAQAGAHKMNGEYDLAANAQMDIIRLSECVGNGGLVVDLFVQIAVAAIGREDLRTIRTQLSPETCRRMAAELAAIDRNAEPWQAHLRRDRIWSVNKFGWCDRLYEASGHLLGIELLNEQAVRDASNRHLASQRLLMTELALLAYRHEHGSFPDSLDGLIPEYLGAVPIDPYRGESLVYRTIGEEFTLYSVGGNGVDDGGQFVPFEEAVWGEGDYFLDLSDLDDP